MVCHTRAILESSRIPMMQLEMNWTVLPGHTERMAERSKILDEYRSEK